MPVVDGRSPSITLVREGLQIGAWQWALVNSVPRFASASICGVRACGCPSRQPTQSFKSSMTINSTFGFSAAAANGRNALLSSTATISMENDLQVMIVA